MRQTKKEEVHQMQQRKTMFAAFEREVLDLYEQETLTTGLLDQIASRYRQIAIDCSGSQLLLTRDGVDVYQLCIRLIDPAFPLVVRGSSEDHDEYWERELQKWEEIMYVRWGWRRERAGSPVLCQQDEAA